MPSSFFALSIGTSGAQKTKKNEIIRNKYCPRRGSLGGWTDGLRRESTEQAAGWKQRVANRRKKLKSPSATPTAPTAEEERMQKVSPAAELEVAVVAYLAISSWASGSAAAGVILRVIQASSFTN